MVGHVVFAAVLVLFIVVMGALYHEATRPINETDEWCSQVDIELDRGQGWRA